MNEHSSISHDDEKSTRDEDAVDAAVVTEVDVVADGVPLNVRNEDVGSDPDDAFHFASTAQLRLSALIEITRTLGKALALDEVLPKVLSSLFKIFLQADRGFIVLRSEDGSLVPRWTKSRRLPAQSETIRISRAIVRRVMDSKEAILSHDVATDDRLDMSQSIGGLRIRSAMCAPLLDSEGTPLGALQVDTLDQRKRFQAEDLEVLTSVAIQAGIAIDNAQLHEQALRQIEIKRDLELAQEVQQALLPRSCPVPPGYESYSFYRPAREVGGDYYDFVALPDGRTAVIVADVAGHGLSSAIMTASLAMGVKACIASPTSPATAVTRLNDLLSSRSVDRFVTLIMVVLDPLKHEATIVNAGQMPPIWKRSNGHIEEPGSHVSGLPMGIQMGQRYDQTTVPLAQGDILLLYTNGVTEVLNSAGETYTTERLRSYLKTASGDVEKVGKEIISDLARHAGAAPQSDDMCFVILSRRS